LIDNDRIYALDYEFNKPQLLKLYDDLAGSQKSWPWHLNNPEGPWSKRGYSVKFLYNILAGRAPRDSVPRFVMDLLEYFSPMGPYISIGFFHTVPNFEYPVHTDQGGVLKGNGPQASVNVILSDDAVPICFTQDQQIDGPPYEKGPMDYEYEYNAALINTSWPHYIINGDKERIVFRMAIFPPSDFYQAREGLKSLGH
jgi:hypothetical protein